MMKEIRQIQKRYDVHEDSDEFGNLILLTCLIGLMDMQHPVIKAAYQKSWDALPVRLLKEFNKYHGRAQQ